MPPVLPQEDARQFPFVPERKAATVLPVSSVSLHLRQAIGSQEVGGYDPERCQTPPDRPERGVALERRCAHVAALADAAPARDSGDTRFRRKHPRAEGNTHARMTGPARSARRTAGIRSRALPMPGRGCEATLQFEFRSSRDLRGHGSVVEWWCGEPIPRAGPRRGGLEGRAKPALSRGPNALRTNRPCEFRPTR